MRTTRTLVLGVAVATLLGCAGDRGVSTRGAVTVHGDHGQVTVAFSDRDRAEIRRYFARHLPPGLAKRERLPPGLEKQLARRGTLPPGLQGNRLPAELERRLSRLPEGYIRLRIATDVVLLDARTRVVLDIVDDIGR